MRIVEGDLDDPRVIELLEIHLTSARAQTAPGSAHALELTGLKSPDISVWTIWENATLIGVGALKRLADHHGEVKSMHTARAMRGKGAGSAMLRHIIAAAKAGGCRASAWKPVHGGISIRPVGSIGNMALWNVCLLAITCSIPTVSSCPLS